MTIQKFFKSSKAHLAIEVDKDKAHPGEELEVYVEVIPKKDFCLKQGKVELVRIETYIDRVQEHNERTFREYYYKKRTRDRIIVEEIFLKDANMSAGNNYSSDVKLTVPQNVIPTLYGAMAEGIIPGVSWEIRSKLDVPRAIDPYDEKDLVILPSDHSGAESMPSPMMAESKRRKCILTMSINQNRIHSEETLEGIVRVEMRKDVEASCVRVELERIERFGDVSKTITVKEIRLAHAEELQSSSMHDWPFSFNIGKVSVPTLQLDKSYVKWKLSARLDIKMRMDPIVEQELIVTC